MVENNRLIPNHQFDFRQRLPTIEQKHQIIQRINEALEKKQYCSAEVFIHLTSIRQILENWHFVQVKTVSPSELFLWHPRPARRQRCKLQ
jgi:hypothetical protein